MLHVHLFGTFAIDVDVSTLARAELGATARRLAAFLFSFPNKLHRREKIIDLLWCDADGYRARAAFSTALWRIRGILATDPKEQIAVRATPRDVCLELNDTRVVDAHHFRVSTVDALAASGEMPDFDALERAAGLYVDPFLEEYDDDWVLDQRERLQALYIRALGKLMRGHAHHARYEDALSYGRRILASDPMRETVQRAVMLLYILNGQRGEAIRQFERCQDALRRECDVEPAPETRALLGLIRSGEAFAKLPQLVETTLSTSAADRHLSS